MSDMKLYKILENFDSLTKRETPYDKDVNEMSANESPGSNTFKINSMSGSDSAKIIDVLEKNGIKYNKHGSIITIGLDRQSLDASTILSHLRRNFVQFEELSEIDEAQTKVQTVGDKVRVTTDGDTTEFDDAETAKAMMGGAGMGEDENQFATEDVDAQDPPTNICPDCEGEGPEDGVECKRCDGNGIISEDNELEEVIDEDCGKDHANEEELEEGIISVIPDEIISDDDDDDVEYSTFDAENPMHRKRLQRGTPVVLDPSICSNPEEDRTGIFINRSPSGHFGTVMRNCDGKEKNVHLSDIVSADITNNSIYEEYNLNLEEMLAEDTETKEKWGVFQTGGSIGGKKDDSPMKTFDTKGEAQEKAKSLRKGLSKGEKGYYKMGYKVKKINEDVTVTRTSNMDNPENDTVTVTGVGEEAADELESIMQNAGLGQDQGYSEYAPDDVVDTGEPVAISQAQGLEPLPMLPADDEPEIESLDTMMEPSDEELFGIENDSVLDREFDDGVDRYDAEGRWDPRGHFDASGQLIGAEDLADKEERFDRLQDLNFEDDGSDFDDIEPTNFELSRIENDGLQPDDFELDLEIEEERDIRHANTPDEVIADVDVALQGGGLNKPKQMFKKEYPGDNPMAFESEELEEVIDKSGEITCPHCKGKGKDKRDSVIGEPPCESCQGSGKIKSIDEDKDEPFFVNEHEDVDNFLSLYKEFQIRGEKKS